MGIVFASLFSGGGLADIGAIQAGCELAWGVELDERIAEVGRSNLRHNVKTANILDCDPLRFEKPDILWASPPCPNFSAAKTNGKETELDRQLAQKVVDFIKTLLPPVFILENVEGYKRSKSLEFIEGALYSLGYWCDRQILNAADFGVPQTRKRLILRAIRGGFPAPFLPPVKWIGWYEAIEDLIPSLPESRFADWQLKRLNELTSTSLVDAGVLNSFQSSISVREYGEPSLTIRASSANQVKPKAFLVESKNANQQYGNGLRSVDEPATTVTTDGKPSHLPKALLIESKYPGRNGPLHREADYPAPICTAMDQGWKGLIVSDQRSSSEYGIGLSYADEPVFTVTTKPGVKAGRAWLDRGRVVAMTARALARFQTVPDWYELPSKNTLACRIIGNGVPCKLAEEIIKSATHII